MLKTIFNCKMLGRMRGRGLPDFLQILKLGVFFVALAVGGEGALVLAPRAALAADEPGRTTQRLAQVVDYVAADYPGAVRDGQIIEESEWNEQRELLAEARKLVPELGGSESDRALLTGQLSEVAQAVEKKAAPEAVQKLCRTVRQTLKQTFALRMVPAATVDAARGGELYRNMCQSCHGATGHADTQVAAELKPRPVSFHDAERMAKVSPSLAFHTLTFGVQGTAMAPFDQLSAQDRWNLAFYVTSLRHGQPGAATALPTGLSGKLPQRLTELAALAELSDEELAAELAAAGLTPDAAAAALSYLRSAAPFFSAAAGGAGHRFSGFAQARAMVSSALAAAEKGDFKQAHRLAIAAYLDGIEPHEATLRIERPELLSRIEGAFATLRQASDPGKQPSFSTMTREAKSIAVLLAEAEAGHGDKAQGGAAKAFIASLVIALREGLEVALLIAALLAFLRKSGQAALARSVHVGWLCSVPAGILTFALVGKLMDGASRELAEGVLTLVAAAILLSVTHFVLGAKEARHWLGFLRRRVEAVGQTATGGSDGEAQEGRGQSLWLAGIAFLAAYREALETALFYRALLLDVGPAGFRPVLLGIVVGVLLLAVVVVVVGRLGRKLNPRPVMLASSALLALLALSLTGHGVHSLQEGGYLPMSLVMIGGAAFSGLPTLGVYGTWEGLAAQSLVLVLLFLPSLIEKLRSPRTGGAAFAAPTRA
jgi:high-affinity iron transporter